MKKQILVALVSSFVLGTSITACGPTTPSGNTSTTKKTGTTEKWQYTAPDGDITNTTYTYTSENEFTFKETITPKTGTPIEAEGSCVYSYTTETKGVATYTYTKPSAGKFVADFDVTDSGNTYSYKITSVDDALKPFIGEVGGTFVGKLMK